MDQTGVCALPQGLNIQDYLANVVNGELHCAHLSVIAPRCGWPSVYHRDPLREASGELNGEMVGCSCNSASDSTNQHLVDPIVFLLWSPQEVVVDELACNLVGSESDNSTGDVFYKGLAISLVEVPQSEDWLVLG